MKLAHRATVYVMEEVIKRLKKKMMEEKMSDWTTDQTRVILDNVIKAT